MRHKTYMDGGADFESEGREFESLRARHEINGLSPAIYAAQRRSAALRSTDGSAPRTATTTAQQGTTDAQNSNCHWIKVGGNVTPRRFRRCRTQFGCRER